MADKNVSRITKSLINFSNKEDFLRKHGLNKFYEFDGGDLVDLDDMSTTPVYVGDDGWDEDKLLDEIESLGKWSRDPNKIKKPANQKPANEFDFEKFKAENEFPVGFFNEKYKDWDSVKALFDTISPEATNDLLKYAAQRWSQIKLDRGK